MRLWLMRATIWLSALISLALVLAAGVVVPIVALQITPLEYWSSAETRVTPSGLKALNVYVGPGAFVMAERDSTRAFPTFTASGGYLLWRPLVRMDGQDFWAACAEGEAREPLRFLDPCHVDVDLRVPKGVQLNVHVAADGSFSASEQVIIASLTRE